MKNEKFKSIKHKFEIVQYSVAQCTLMYCCSTYRYVIVTLSYIHLRSFNIVLLTSMWLPVCLPYKDVVTMSSHVHVRRYVAGWRSCTKQMRCSQTCVRKYMGRYGDRCARRAGRYRATCQDYARVHNGGPNGCRNSRTLGYWRKISACCRRRGGC